MSSLGPHISVASTAYLRTQRKDIETAQTQALAVRMGVGWLTMNTQGTILSASPFALQLLAKSEPVFGQIGGRLALDSAGAKRLGAILAETAGHVLRLPFGELAILPRADPQSVVTAYLRVQTDARPAPIRALADLAQITPSEARFALKLGDGLTIVQAAEELGLTVETARNYSKKIYAKMGLRGQTDLIRMLENSAIRLI
jgi:DNA-binding CsgD family transcriptional regulator